IARRLRPETLDLGLLPALADLSERLADQMGPDIERHLPGELPRLTPEEELVLYRVAQEALTNVVRHAASERAELSLEHRPDRVRLRVRDHGRGLQGPPGGGTQGMRERALLVNGELAVKEPADGGVEVTLDVPLQEAGLWYR
nr:sensor histidine kinase [Thermoleophilaceae bacterium]